MRFILQAVTAESHLAALKEVLGLAAPARIIISTAFMNRSGLTMVSPELTAVAGSTTIIAGIRNGITSVQGLKKAVDLGCRVLVVDTGTRTRIFHPKVYYARNPARIRIMVGSANLTGGGLTGNIEASILQDLDLAEATVSAFSADIETKLDGMVGEYPQHVLEITTHAEIDALLDAGRVVDERKATPPTPVAASTDRDLDSVPTMPLKTPPPPKPPAEAAVPTAAAPAPVAGPAPAPTAVPAAPAPAAPVAPAGSHLTLVWESNPLTRRPLNIPTGANTNQTGSMLFTKGAWEGIDQRHYFRDDVFAALAWTNDPAPGLAHMERAEARFQIVIKNVDYGIYTMRISHNSRTDTAAYAQNNSMTQLHWGDVRDLIAREDLLGRTLYLYRDETAPDLFVLEID